MRRAAVATILILLAVSACAKREPPSGGPPDLIPPRLIASIPDSGTARVPLDATVSLTFSEGMEPRSTGDAVALAPRVEIRRRAWHGRTLTLTLAAPLKPHQTYTLSIAGSARDRHGNGMGTGATVVLSTADRFPPGRIEGEIEGRGVSAPGVAIWCYNAVGGHEPDSTAQDFEAVGLADAQGRFRIDGLAVPGRYRLWAFADANGNRSFEPQTDILARIDTTLDLGADHPVAGGLKVVVINPHAPGRVRGTVLDSLADSVGVVRLVAQSEKDSTRRIVVDVDPGGQFDLQLDAGAWDLRAFRDLDRSRNWQPERERGSDRLHLVVEPAADLVELKLRIRPKSGGP